MNEMIKALENKIETNKMFTYMVIHDLKHPTESLIDCLEILKNSIGSLATDSMGLSCQTKNMSKLLRVFSTNSAKLSGIN